MQSLIKSAIDLLKDYINTNFDGNVSEASRAIGIHEQTVYKWIKGERLPSFSKIEPFLKHIEAKLLTPSQLPKIQKELCFVEKSSSQFMQTYQDSNTSDYISVPLIEQDNVKDFSSFEHIKTQSFLVNKNSPHIEGRTNLFAVRISQTASPIFSLLSPADILIIDRDDKTIHDNTNQLFLVHDPLANVLIRRVSISEKGHSVNKLDTTIIFTSLGSNQHLPEIYSLREDYLGDWQKVIIGKVVSAFIGLVDK